MAQLKISLAAARVNANMTQEEAADRVKVSRSSILKWESGKTPITFQKLNELAEVYGISVDNIRMPSESTLRGEQ